MCCVLIVGIKAPFVRIHHPHNGQHNLRKGKYIEHPFARSSQDKATIELTNPLYNTFLLHSSTLYRLFMSKSSSH